MDRLVTPHRRSVKHVAEEVANFFVKRSVVISAGTQKINGAVSDPEQWAVYHSGLRSDLPVIYAWVESCQDGYRLAFSEKVDVQTAEECYKELNQRPADESI